MDFGAFQPPIQTWIVPPKGEHKHTFILLHGRGDTAYLFGAGLLSTHLSKGLTLRNIYQGAKFIFLQAPLRELTASPGTKFYQWFDLYDLKPGSEESDLQVPALRETAQLVHGSLREEIELVGAENVVLGGLSQGCASALVSTLLWDGAPFAACVGMSGWLPFRNLLESAVAMEDTVTTEAYTPSAPGCSSIAALAERLGYAKSYPIPLVFQKIPVFLGHGTDDDVVVTRLGEEAAACVGRLKAKVIYKEYEDLDHWYSPQMLRDVVKFLQTEAFWDIGQGNEIDFS